MIVFVRDMEKSRDFYERILGQKVEENYGTIVIYENRLAIHDGTALCRTVFGRAPIGRRKWGRRNIDIYFETDDLAEAERTPIESGVRLIHRTTKRPWGESVVRCHDPDGHIVENGEAMRLERLKGTGS
jgi:catechol 2,3-dioxygenase-like lactoylglutathione lyase family enzyme